MDAKNSSDMEKSKAHRHTPDQIQELERSFEGCPNPNEKQRMELSRQLGLTKDQVKYWFQNKRNQKKVHDACMDKTALESNIESLKFEIQARTELLENVTCSGCDDHPPIGKEETKEMLRRENAQLNVKLERKSNMVTSMTGKPISHFLSMPPESFQQLESLPTQNFIGQQSGSSSGDPYITSINSYNPIAAGKPIIAISEEDKLLMLQNASNSLNELQKLLESHEPPLWVMSPTYGGSVLHDENYSKIFPKSRHLKMSSSRIESSKESAEVPIAASELAKMFLDMKTWTYLYPTIVMEAKVIETLGTGSIRSSLYLMYQRVHILSSLVAPREFVFLRYFNEISPSTWLIMDISYDCFKENQHMPPTHSWMFPSGVMIQSLPNGNSMVTWVNHVEFNESLTYPPYRNLLSTLHGYGAKRWLTNLKRMFERIRSLYSFSLESTITSELQEGIKNFKSRKNIMALSHRMIKDYFAILSMPERSDLSVFSKYQIKMSIRDHNEPGQPRGSFVVASTSIWLPITYENIFNFLRDHGRRPEWDLTLNGSPVIEIGRIPTGSDHMGNAISVFKTEKQNKVLLQENSIDHLGAFIIFAELESQIINAVMNGEDSKKISILPCGFSISDDGGPITASTSSSTGSSIPLGSLVTLVFQAPVLSVQSLQTLKETSKALNNFVISIIETLKASVGYSELDHGHGGFP